MIAKCKIDPPDVESSRINWSNVKLSCQTNEVYFIIFKGFQISMQFSLVGITDHRFEHKNLPLLVLNEKKPLMLFAFYTLPLYRKTYRENQGVLCIHITYCGAALYQTLSLRHTEISKRYFLYYNKSFC